MRVLTITKAGPPETLRIEERPDPRPGPGEVAVAVEATGINFADIMGRMGIYPDAPRIPFVPGYEVAGRVAELGDGVAERYPSLKPGDRVMAITHFGGYATRAVAEAAKVFPMPDGWDAPTGAALLVNYLTAWLAIVEMGRVREGEHVLIHGAAGGVGIAAVQIAMHLGARVIATAGSDAKLEYLRELGVERRINYRATDFAAEVRAAVDGAGVQLVLDPVGGGETTRKNVELLDTAGRLVLYGVSGLAQGERRNVLKMLPHLVTMPRFTLRGLTNRNIGVFGLNLLRLAHRNDLLHATVSRLLDGVQEGWVTPRVDRTFPLEEGAAAHRYVQGRANIGKVVLVT